MGFVVSIDENHATPTSYLLLESKGGGFDGCCRFPKHRALYINDLYGPVYM